MKQYTTKAGLLAVLVALLVGSQAWGQTKEEFQDLRRDLKDLRDDVERLRANVDRDRRETALTNRALLNRLEEMTQELKRLNDGSTVRSTSGFGRDVMRATGTLRLTNNRFSTATVTIDGVPYTVEPRSTRLLRDRLSGPLSYEVEVDGYTLPMRTTRLYNNETLTVNIY